MKRPNVLFILSDDQGAWALGSSGNQEIITPNLDALSRQGMRFDNFFCASPVCSPARASILTGTIPSRHGIHDWLRGGNLDMEQFPFLKTSSAFGGYGSEHKAIPYLSHLTSYTDLMQQTGYTCALSGKWHLGDSVTPQHGFSPHHWFTIGRGGCDYYEADLVTNGSVHFSNRYITDLITQNAVENIQTLSKQPAPFYLSVHYTAPHSPWDEKNHPAHYLSLYDDCPFHSVPDREIHPWQIASAPYGTGEKRLRNLKGYYAAVTAMDEGIGQIINALKDNDIYQDTLIIFTSDNGMNMGHHGIWGKGNGTFPQNMFDTSVKVPFIVSHPGHIPADVIHSMHSHYDLLPTLRDYLSLNGTVSQPLAGNSFSAVLKKQAYEPASAVFIYDEYGPVRMVRTKEWKYVHRYPYGPHELYSLLADPEEENNLFDTPSHDCITAELKAQLDSWFTRHSDPNVDGSKEPVNGMGQIRQAGVHSNGQPAFADLKKFARDR